MKEITNEYCYDTIKHVPDALSRATNHEAWVVGGIVIAGLSGDAQFSPETKQIKVDPETDLPVWRELVSPRDRLTRRDLDIVVGGVLGRKEARRIYRDVRDAVDNLMPVSIFSFQNSYPSILTSAERAKLSATRFVSERTVDADGRTYMEMFPLRVEVPKEIYESWSMLLPNGADLPVMHPLTTLMNYGGRSIAGLRPKDVKKCNNVRDTLLGDIVTPDAELKPHQIVFRRQQKEHFDTLADYNEAVTSIASNGKASKVSPELLHPDARISDLQRARRRAQVVRTGERFPSVVSFFQQDGIQRIARPFIGHHS